MKEQKTVISNVGAIAANKNQAVGDGVLDVLLGLWAMVRVSRKEGVVFYEETFAAGYIAYGVMAD